MDRFPILQELQGIHRSGVVAQKALAVRAQKRTAAGGMDERPKLRASALDSPQAPSVENSISVKINTQLLEFSRALAFPPPRSIRKGYTHLGKMPGVVVIRTDDGTERQSI